MFNNPWVIGWILLGLCVIALAFYRKAIAKSEDDVVHVTSGGSGAITNQVTLAQRLQKIDFWGKTLTIVLAVYGIALIALVIINRYNSYYAPVS